MIGYLSNSWASSSTWYHFVSTS